MMIQSLILVASAVIVGQVMGASVQKDGSLIAHPPQRDSLDKDQIVKKLKDLRFNDKHQGKVAEFVAEQLYNAKDKENMYLVNGVAADALIEINNVNVPDVCTKRSLKNKARLYEKTKPAKAGEVGLAYGVNVYVLRVLRETVDYCIAHKGDAVSQELLKEGWIHGLAQNVPKKSLKDKSSPAEMDEAFVNKNGAQSSDLASYILQ